MVGIVLLRQELFSYAISRSMARINIVKNANKGLHARLGGLDTAGELVCCYSAKEALAVSYRQR